MRGLRALGLSIGVCKKATQLCQCGFHGHPEKQCTCTPLQIQRYRSRLSGPLLDRIDLNIQLSPVKYGHWAQASEGESSSAIRERVLRARAVQTKRFEGTNVTANAFMSVSQIRKFCALPPDGSAVLESAMSHFGLSARSLDKIMKVARTIADLEGAPEITKAHLMEVIQYRAFDRNHSL